MDSMVRSETPEPAGTDQSIGDLVALALKDVSQLVHYEIDLAKSELKGDARRIGLAAALGGAAAFVGCVVIVLISIAFAFGLITLGIWDWAAFLIAAGTWILLAAIALLIAYLRLRGLSGLRRTRKTVSEDIKALRHDDQQPEITAPK
jgi:Putative Actinobacterial Holin-X, holin superfamily III